MVKVFNKIDQYKGDSPFEAWVRRIMINECLMYLRKTKKMTLLETSIDTYEEKIAGHWPEDSIDSEVLVRLIQSLPSGYRSVFNLYAIEGYSHAEVAEMLQINVNTSKSQLSRARSFLQKKLVALNIQKPKNYRNEIT
jgi:RNA polymerase sigma factor (sigma-70 family)